MLTNFEPGHSDTVRSSISFRPAPRTEYLGDHRIRYGHGYRPGKLMAVTPSPLC